MAKLRSTQSVRDEAFRISNALDRLEARWLRLFPHAEGQPGNGDPVTETYIGIGQAQAYISGIQAMSEAALINEIKQGRAALASATDAEGA